MKNKTKKIGITFVTTIPILLAVLNMFQFLEYGLKDPSSIKTPMTILAHLMIVALAMAIGYSAYIFFCGRIKPDDKNNILTNIEKEKTILEWKKAFTVICYVIATIFIIGAIHYFRMECIIRGLGGLIIASLFAILTDFL